MAPQATTPTIQPPAPSASAPPAGHKQFIPVTLLIFLGLCLAYTLSYVLYRIIMARRRQSEEDLPDSPDRGVSQFMNGARLTLNINNNQKSTPATQSGSPDTHDEEKPLADTLHPPHPEIPTNISAETSSTPLIVMMQSFTIQPDQELGGAQLQEQGPTEGQVPNSALAPTQHFSQHVATKAKLLSTDRAEAITLDPKLAPVQGPLRPLSMIPSPSRKKRMTLFGLGLKQSRAHDGDSGTHSVQ